MFNSRYAREGPLRENERGVMRACVCGRGRERVRERERERERETRVEQA